MLAWQTGQTANTQPRSNFHPRHEQATLWRRLTQLISVAGLRVARSNSFTLAAEQMIPTLNIHHNRILIRLGFGHFLAKLLVVVLVGLVIGSSGYFVTAYPQVRDWIAAKNPVLHGPSSVLTAPQASTGGSVMTWATFVNGE